MGLKGGETAQLHHLLGHRWLNAILDALGTKYWTEKKSSTTKQSKAKQIKSILSAAREQHSGCGSKKPTYPYVMPR
jgi:hypothetical protein